MDAPRPAPPVHPAGTPAPVRRDLGSNPGVTWLSVPSWPRPGPSPVPWLGHPGGGARLTLPPRFAAAPARLPDLARPPTPGRPGLCGASLSPAQRRSAGSASSSGHFAKCSPSARRRCVTPGATERGRWAQGPPGQSSGSGVHGRGFWGCAAADGLIHWEDWSGESAASSGAPPGMLVRGSGGGGTGSAAGRGGVLGAGRGLHAAELLQGRPRGAPTRSAPQADSRAEAAAWRDPWGRGAAWRRPEAKARGARGDGSRPPRSCRCTSGLSSKVWVDRL